MPDYKLNELTEASSVVDADILHIRNASGIDKKITAANAFNTRLDTIEAAEEDFETQFFSESFSCPTADTIRTKVFTFSTNVKAVVDVQVQGIRTAVQTLYSDAILWACTISNDTVTVSLRQTTAVTTYYFSFYITVAV